MTKQLTREKAAQLAAGTVRILEVGSYIGPEGDVDITGMLRTAVEGTQSYPPNATMWDHPMATGGAMQIEVTNETTFAAAKRLVDAGLRTVALNFASGIHPGGGFLIGSIAQEEYLARNSGLYACIKDNPMYAFHQEQNDPMCTGYAIYSPDVPVIRDEENNRLAKPWPCSIITMAAPNLGSVRWQKEERLDEVQPELTKRVVKILQIAEAHGHKAIVLGAWGCGVYRNDPHQMAQLFKWAMEHPFRGAFDRIIFAIYDTTREQVCLRPFQEAFAPTK